MERKEWKRKNGNQAWEGSECNQKLNWNPNASSSTGAGSGSGLAKKKHRERNQNSRANTYWVKAGVGSTYWT